MIKKYDVVRSQWSRIASSLRTIHVLFPSVILPSLNYYYYIMLRYVTCLPEDLTVEKSRSHLVVYITVNVGSRRVAARGKALLLIIRHGRRCIDFTRSSRSISRPNGQHPCGRVGLKSRFKSPDFYAHKNGTKINMHLCMEKTLEYATTYDLTFFKN